MSITASFFDHVKYPAQEFINRDKDFIGNGVLKPTTDFALTYNSNMTANIGAGTSWVNGVRIGYDANPSLMLNFATSDTTNPRIDLIEIGTTGTGQQGAGVIKVVKGVPQATPLQPQPDSGFIALYAVRVNAGVTSISATNVTDLRSGISIAGATNTPLSSSVPGTQIYNTTGSAGTSNYAARADHIHPMPNITPSGIGAEPTITTKNTAFNQNFETSASNIKMDGTASAGTSSNVARADHIHPTDTSRAPLANPTFTGTVTIPSLALSGDIYVSDNTSERKIRSASGGGIGLFIGSTSFGGYDWVNSREVFRYTPASNQLQLMSSGGKVITKNNTLDDGSGGMSIAGDVQIGTTPFILSKNGLSSSPNRTYGAIGQWNEGVGVQGTKNAGATTNDIFAVITNDNVNYFKVTNGGKVTTANSILDDGAGNVIVGNGILANGNYLNIVPKSAGQVGFTNNARSKWGLVVTDVAGGNPNTRTNSNILDDGSGGMVLAGSLSIANYKQIYTKDTSGANQNIAVLDNANKMWIGTPSYPQYLQGSAIYTNTSKGISNTLDDGNGNANFIGNIMASNPANLLANVSLSWDSSNNPRIRIGGSGNGALGTFRIQGTGDSDRMTLDSNGNMQVTGSVKVANKFTMQYNSTEDSLDFIYG